MFPDKSPRPRTCIWQRPDWPLWRYDATALAAPLAQVHRAQGHLAGRMAELGLAQRDQATLQALTQEVVTTSAIEGEALNLDAVRSSIARRLGVDIGALAPADRDVDGVVDMVLDATQQHAQPLTGGHRGQVLQRNTPPAKVCRWHDLCASNSPGACFMSPRAEIGGSPFTWKMLIAGNG